MKLPYAVMLLLCLSAAMPVQAGLFGESEAEKEAKVVEHVADLMREPNKLIAQAQDATEAGDIEEAIRLFSQAQDMFLQIEAEEDTKDPAFATFRLKKFHCISMLDALALKRSEVMDVRQAVTDTSELEARLAKEREAIVQEEEAQKQATELPKPPTWQDQLKTKVLECEAAEATVIAAEQALAALDQTISEGEIAIKEAAKAYSAADAALFVARTQKGDVEAATATAQACQETLKQAREAVAKAKSSRGAAEKKVADAQQILAQRQAELKVIRQEIAAEEAAAAAEQARLAEEQKRLEAEALLKQQEAAREAEKLRAAEAKAAADAEELKAEIAWCQELWRLKRIEALEKRITEAAVKWNAPEFMVLLARIRMVQGRYDDALEIAAMVPGEGEVGLQAQMVASGVYLTKNQPFEAMKVLEVALKAHPENPTPWFNMAVTLLRLPEIDPKRDLAARHYNRSVELGGKRSAAVERRLNME